MDVKRGYKKEKNMITKIKPKNISKDKKNFRETLKFYLIDCKTPLGKIIDIIIILLNFLICILFVIETYPVSQSTINTLWKIEVIVVAFFILEYIARLYASDNKLKHIVNIFSIIDLIAILPTILLMFFPAGNLVNIRAIKLIRVFRVFRIFRFLRFTQDADFFFGKISFHLLKIVQLFLTLIIIFFVSSGLFYTVESPVNPGIQTFGDAFYFTVVSLTTVGFGDIVPVSNLGRTIIVLMILSGIILIPWQASQIIREWFRASNKKKVICKKCGLRYHDKDASHCKSCGNVIYQEYDD